MWKFHNYFHCEFWIFSDLRQTHSYTQFLQQSLVMGNSFESGRTLTVFCYHYILWYYCCGGCDSDSGCILRFVFNVLYIHTTTVDKLSLLCTCMHVRVVVVIIDKVESINTKHIRSKWCLSSSTECRSYKSIYL